MSSLPNDPIVIFYHGVLFPTETQSSFEARPVYDASGRTVKMVVYEITVKSTLRPDNLTGSEVEDDTTGSTMEELKKRLNSPACTLSKWLTVAPAIRGRPGS